MSDSKDIEGWTCYHCGEHFITHTRAKLHFGIEHTGALPACLIKGSEGGLVKYIRELEERLIPYQNEDTELMRNISRQRGEKLNAIASAEEVGYARGLKEYTKLEEEIERLKNELAAALAACEMKDAALREVDTMVNNQGLSHQLIVKALAIRPDSKALAEHDNEVIKKILLGEYEDSTVLNEVKAKCLEKSRAYFKDWLVEKGHLCCSNATWDVDLIKDSDILCDFCTVKRRCPDHGAALIDYHGE